MRHVHAYVFALAVGLAYAAFACGGGTPAPKPEAVAENKPSPPDTDAAPAPAPSATTEPAPAPVEDAGAASAEDDPWTAFRHMSGDEVLRTMKPVGAKVHACVTDGLKRDPSASGEIRVRFVITQAGKVLAWKDESSSISDEGITKCIGDLLKSLKFPAQKSPGNSLGVYTVHLSN